MRATTLSLALLAVEGAALAGEPGLTLSQAQAEARAHAPESAELEARLRGAEAVAADARRALREDPSFSVNYRTGAPAGRPDESAVDLSLALPLDVSGSWKLRGAAASAELEGARFDREDGLRALDEAVAIAFAEMARSQRSKARIVRIVSLQSFGTEAARKELDLGKGSQLDVDAADLDLAAARASRTRATGELETARIGLARLLGRDSTLGLTVEDADEAVPEVPPFDGSLVEDSPKLKSAQSELDAARLTLSLHERLVWPIPTLSLGYGWQRRDLPPGAFASAPGLSASWTDQELSFGLSFPLPLFERQREPRARAFARIQSAQAALRVAWGGARARLATSWTGFRTAADALRELSGTPAILNREFDLIERAVRAGALDALARAQALRRLSEAGQRYDDAVFDLRAARARWLRWTGSTR
jgi:cobalt-zinc-cadmium efflux system outer membrane protein